MFTGIQRIVQSFAFYMTLNITFVAFHSANSIFTLQSGVNGSLNQTPIPVTSPEIPQVTATKPAPPPRDHLKIEKDGRLVNRAPAPQVPARLPINNSTNSNTTSPPTVTTTPTAVVEPTREQLDSIKKYQVGGKLCRITINEKT